jgi:hypothetical protein
MHTPSIHNGSSSCLLNEYMTYMNACWLLVTAANVIHALYVCLIPTTISPISFTICSHLFGVSDSLPENLETPF